MSGTQQTLDELFDSLTGFDEIAIAQQFGRTVGDLASSDQTMWGRALIFVAKRRDGLSDDEARNEALGMQMKDSLDFFAAPAEAAVGVDEVTAAAESGKDEPQPENLPETLPSSASQQDEVRTSTSV